MPEQIFDETCAKVADFLIQNSGNFRFSTSIQSDALTLSFCASPLPSLSSNDNTSSSSLSYSPIQWEDWTDEPDGPNIVDANSLVPAAVSQFHAGSQDSVGKVPAEHLSKDPLSNGSRADVSKGVDLIAGAGVFFPHHERLQTLAEGLSSSSVHHSSNVSQLTGNAIVPNDSHFLGNAIVPNDSHLPGNVFVPNDFYLLGNAIAPNISQLTGNAFLPNVSHTMGNVIVPNVSQLMGNTIVPNDSHFLGHAFLPNISHTMGNVIVPNISHFLGNVIVPNVSQLMGNVFLPNVSHTMGNVIAPNDSHFSGHMFAPNDSHLPGNVFVSNDSYLPGNAIVPNDSHFSGHVFVPNVSLTMGNVIVPNAMLLCLTFLIFRGHALVLYDSHHSGNNILPNNSQISGNNMVPNVSHFSGNATMPIVSQYSGALMPRALNSHTNITPYTYAKSPVLSASNEPCFVSNPTFAPDPDPDLRNDALIPPIDAILDNVFIRDFARNNNQGQGVKTEPELEEGEINQGTQVYVPEGGHIESAGVYNTLNTILTCAAQDEHIRPFVNGYLCSSTASTPPYASLIVLSPSVYSISDESVDVYYMNSSPAHSTHSLTYPITPPNSKAKLSTIYENEDEHMPSLIPTQTFAPESNVREDANVKHHSPSPAPMSGTIPYHRITRVDGQMVISFDRITHLEAKQHLMTKYAKYNDYHSVYIPNVVEAIESFCFCQDRIIASNWNSHMFQDGAYPGHPVIPGGLRLPTGGPRSRRTWHERVCELQDHRAHTQHLINVIETVLSTHMLAEASTQASTIKCDHMLHIQGGLTPKTYKGQYEDMNPFFSKSKNKCLNLYTAIVENHGEPILASKILEALLMPCPDEDTISALTEFRLLNIGSIKDILRLVLDRDLVLGITCTGLTVISMSPFHAEKFEDPFYSKEWFILSDNSENSAKVLKSKGKKFFL
ncbi:hypothetical protein BDR05DRAFT_1004402 [Suillus weaverae]|nr:hypothetical protein BDR05DRAFT_1004402 [Suillus weaverae]